MSRPSPRFCMCLVHIFNSLKESRGQISITMLHCWAECVLEVLTLIEPIIQMSCMWILIILVFEKCRPFNLPGELEYRETYRDHLHALPQANEDNALWRLLTIICRCERFISKCCSLFCYSVLSPVFIKGDFHCCDLWKSIPKLHLHTNFPTGRNNTLYKSYTDISNSYTAVVKQHFQLEPCCSASVYLHKTGQSGCGLSQDCDEWQLKWTGRTAGRRPSHI